MKYYDYDKAIKLITESADSIKSASLGMHEDWFWTAQTIFEGGEWKKQLLSNEKARARNDEYLEKRKAGMSLLSDEAMEYDDALLGGIMGSDWATPTLQLVYKDDEDKMLECFYTDRSDEVDPVDRIATVASKQAMLLGVLSGPCQECITPITNG